jgi:hypothetical protein
MSKGHPSGSSSWRLTNRRVAPLEGVHGYDSPDTDLHTRSFTHLHLMRLFTDNQHMTPAEIALGYKNLLDAERGFRDMKSTLMLRPAFHRLEPRIRARILICWLALLLVRVPEQATGDTWARIAREMDRMAAVTLTGTAGTVIQSTETT